MNKEELRWSEDKVTLEDGTTLEVECLDSDCCAWG